MGSKSIPHCLWRLAFSSVVDGLSYNVPGSPYSGDANVKSCLPAVDAPSFQCVQYSKDHDFCASRLRSQNVAPGHHCMAAGEIGPGKTFSPGFWEVSQRVENDYRVSTPKSAKLDTMSGLSTTCLPSAPNQIR